MLEKLLAISMIIFALSLLLTVGLSFYIVTELGAKVICEE
jgi:hypothetical protein